VDLIECHGTGTPTGDAVEVQSLRELWGPSGWGVEQCAIGSVKSMIGHLLTAAGAAGLIKMLLALREGVLPPSANYRRAAAIIPLAGSPFRVQTEPRDWPRRADGSPRRAAVNAFGFGGINAHVLVEEWDGDVETSKRRNVETSENTNVTKSKSQNEAKGRHDPAEKIGAAVVGMEARFGEVSSLREFQELVLSGGSAIRPRPADRWYGCDARARLDLGGRGMPGAFLKELRVPVGRYRMPPNEIAEILPQQSLMLEVAAEAIEDAGLDVSGPQPRVGVIIGMALDLATTDYHLRWWLPRMAPRWTEQLGLDLSDEDLARWVARLRAAVGPALNATRTIGSLGNIIANRIAREFRFGGPSFAVSCDEASGLRALEIAVRALQREEIDAAVVGAVDLAGDVRAVLTGHARRAFSARGEAKPFEIAADGPTVGEGAAAVVLKRTDEARRDGSRVYAVVRGFGSAGGWTDEGVSPRTYESALRRAYEDAGVAPESVDYLEAHGSGDPREDAIEAAALHAFFDRRSSPVAIGSAGANIGSTGAAAGLAGLVRACLSLHHEIIPPMSGFERPCWPIDERAERLHVPRAPLYWLRDRADGPRRAGVSAMTLDGNVMHVVLEAGPADAPAKPQGAAPGDEQLAVERRQPLGARVEAMFIVEADDVAGLLRRLDDFAAWLRDRTTTQVEAAARVWWRQCRASTTERPPGRFAAAFVAGDVTRLAEAAGAARRRIEASPELKLDGEPPAQPGAAVPHFGGVYVFYSPMPLGPGGELAFVFPGSGNHFAGMGRELAVQWPEVPRGLDHETQRLASQMMPRWYAPYRASWAAGWQREAEAAIAGDPLRMILGQVAYGVFASDVLRRLGVQPQAVIGYSLGESVGLFALRAWTGRDEMWRRMTSSPLFTTDLIGRGDALRRAWGVPEHEPVDWRGAVVGRSAEAVRGALEGVPHARLLIVNAPEECVIGGRRGDVERAIARLGCAPIWLDDVPIIHCDAVGAVEQAYRELHLLPTLPPSGVRFYSAVWGHAYEVGRQSAATSITAQATAGFDFPTVVRRAYEDGVRAFIEVGPQASCTRMISRILAGQPHLARSASVRGESETRTILTLLAALAAERMLIDLDALYGAETRAVGHREATTTPAADLREIVIPIGRPRPVIPMPERFDAPARITSEGESPQPARSASEGEFEKPARSATEVELVRSAQRTSEGMTATSLAADIAEAAAATAAAHEAFLSFTERATQEMTEAVALHAELHRAAGLVGGPSASPESSLQRVSTPRPMPRALGAADVAVSKTAAPVFSREQCLEFARGSAAQVLGPEFAVADSYPVRVRLPDEPLMFVDRILSVEGRKGVLGAGRIVTEHDVRAGAWYLDGGTCPVSISMEAGQADLFLCAYLGIDFAAKGRRVYRLLDATVTFHRELPRAGETLRYDIAIDRFVRQGDTHLFFFRFDGTIGGRPLVTMRNGCAGFFTPEEIDGSGGIIQTAEDAAPAAGRRTGGWRPLAPLSAESYGDAQLAALRAGDLAGCFGPAFAGLPLRDPVRLPNGRMKLLDRVSLLNASGGRWGLGLVRAEADIHADDWFLTCHFVDDRTMPGTLMCECCLQALRFLLLGVGWVGERGGVSYEPIPGLAGTLRCRGPISPTTKKAEYHVEVKEIGYRPEPYAVADALVFADGKRSVQMKDLGLRIVGLSREQIEGLWTQPV
jgi:acyl transferase domain-containing protein/3-hydroxymyristoyl/3-hydroxydecanoyl-(acyl carrier protein) dehydratase